MEKNMDKRTFTVTVMILGCGLVLGRGTPAKPVYAAEEDAGPEQVIEWLNLVRILTPAEREALAGFIEGVAPDEQGILDLRELSGKITRKVENDKNGMAYLLANIERLANDQYAWKIGAIKKSDLKNCREISDNLNKKIVEESAQFSSGPSEPDAEYYLRLIRAYGALLTSEEEMWTIPSLWEALERMVKPAYSAWNREYVNLRKRLRGRQDPLDSISNLYTYQELEFMRKFGDVQAGLRKFSRDDSPDF
ncbi:MAG: hypothetical protein JW847_07600 [Candidatus Omnitrophica bacterium]|nr:hypothetical protein [Candidatus Omnitrophota bacterium]